MEQILESLELAEDTKIALQESFDKAVLVEATKLAESKEADYEAYMLDQIAEGKAKTEATISEYLDTVVEQFIEDNTIAMEESIKIQKYDAVLEGFSSLLIAAGVEISDISEAKAVKDEENTIAEADKETADLADKLMAENIALKDKNAELLKTGLVKESMENMTAIQKDKFLKLASVVEFDASNPSDFITKMDTLVESLKDTKEDVQDLQESVKVTTEPAKAKISHLF